MDCLTINCFILQVLKKHEFFGKYGKIHKVVINQSTSYAGSQGPSASAYVTYQVNFLFLSYKLSCIILKIVCTLVMISANRLDN